MPARSANALISRKSTDRPFKSLTSAVSGGLRSRLAPPANSLARGFDKSPRVLGIPPTHSCPLCSPHFPGYNDILRSHGPYDRDSPVRKFLQPVMHSHARRIRQQFASEKREGPKSNHLSFDFLEAGGSEIGVEFPYRMVVV